MNCAATIERTGLNVAEIVNAWTTHQAVVKAAADELAPLNAKQREVLVLTCKGLSAKEIARNLNMGVSTVDGYRGAITKTLGMSMIEAVVLATRAGWV